MLKRGRRYVYETAPDGSTFWIAWYLYFRVCGLAPTEADAVAAIEHFLENPPRYSLA